jgi:hypothetical protein
MKTTYRRHEELSVSVDNANLVLQPGSWIGPLNTLCLFLLLMPLEASVLLMMLDLLSAVPHQLRFDRSPFDRIGV